MSEIIVGRPINGITLEVWGWDYVQSLNERRTNL